MIVYLGNNDKDNAYNLKSVCELKYIKEEVILIIDKDINLNSVIFENIMIEEVLITLNIKIIICFDDFYIKDLCKKLNIDIITL